MRKLLLTALTSTLIATSAACGGDAVAPTISNLVLQQRTLKLGTAGQGSLHIQDADGDLGQAKVQLKFKHLTGVDVATEIPIQGLVNGATAVDAVLAYGLTTGAPAGAWTLSVSVTDSAGMLSNTLTSTLTLTQ